MAGRQLDGAATSAATRPGGGLFVTRWSEVPYQVFFSYESYSEIKLECLGADNSQYNLLRTVYVGPLGRDVLASVAKQYLSQVIVKKF